MMNPNILETKEITKVFRNNGAEVHALRGINLKIESGELVAVMGPSGCGKSTLLHLLGGLDSPTSGEIWIDGKRIDKLGEGQRAILRRKEIGFVFQAYNLIGNLSVSDNVELPALLVGTTMNMALSRRVELLTSLGVEGKGDSIPSQLSGGEQQRVAMARALINKPTILLADEPTGNLDSKATLGVLRMLRQTHTEGQTILVVTHDPNVASIAQRVIFMKDGQITHETSLQEKADSKNVLLELLDMEA
jgi:putative ABC transport system ATP-binding protein